MSADEVWLVRHGATEWSVAGRHSSVTDLPLTEEGEQQAKEAAAKLAGVEFDLVLTSRRQRARRTAELAGFPDAVVDEDLAEWDYGDYEGLTSAQIQQSVPGWTVFTRPCPGGESAEQVAERLDRVVARARTCEGRVLVFGHGHALRVLTARWLGMPPVSGAHFILGTGTVSVLGGEHGVPAVRRWNG